MGLAVINVGKAGLFGHAFNTLAEAVNVAIDGDIIQINKPSLTLDQTIQNVQPGVRIQGNPNHQRPTIIAPARSYGIFLGAGQRNVEFRNLNFVVPEQSQAVVVSRGGSVTFDHVNMIHTPMDVRVFRPSLMFSGMITNGDLKLVSSAIDVLTFGGRSFVAEKSNLGNVLAAPSLAENTVSVINGPVVNIVNTGLQHVGFLDRGNQNDQPYKDPMIINGSYLGSNVIVQRKAEIKDSLLTPIVAINQNKKNLYYPAQSNGMPGLVVSGKDTNVVCDNISVLSSFSANDQSPFYRNFLTVQKENSRMVPYSALRVIKDGTLTVKNSTIAMGSGNNQIYSGSLTLDQVNDMSTWDPIENPQTVHLTNRMSQSSLFTSSAQSEVLGMDSSQANNKPLTATEELKGMIGLKDVKADMKRLVAKFAGMRMRQKMGMSSGKDKGSTMHMVFAGVPGTGKTRVAHILAKALYEKGVIEEPKCIDVSAADLISDHVGGTMPQTAEVIRSAFGGILLIDEAYALAPDKGGGSNTFKDEALTELVNDSWKYRDKVIIILAGYTNDMKDLFRRGNSGLSSRFPNWVMFPAYKPEELKQIMFYTFKQKKYDVSNPQVVAALNHAMDALIPHQTINSGQGRFVVNFVGCVVDAQAVRLFGGDTNPDTITPQQLKTITVSDVQAGQQAMIKNLSQLE